MIKNEQSEQTTIEGMEKEKVWESDHEDSDCENVKETGETVVGTMIGKDATLCDPLPYSRTRSHRLLFTFAQVYLLPPGKIIEEPVDTFCFRQLQVLQILKLIMSFKTFLI